MNTLPDALSYVMASGALVVWLAVMEHVWTSWRDSLRELRVLEWG